MKLPPQVAYERDVADVRYRAAKWRQGNRIDDTVYCLVCEALESGRNPQATMMALVDLAFNKRNANRPADTADTFKAVLHNQEERVAWWVENKRQGGKAA